MVIGRMLITPVSEDHAVKDFYQRYDAAPSGCVALGVMVQYFGNNSRRYETVYCAYAGATPTAEEIVNAMNMYWQCDAASLP